MLVIPVIDLMRGCVVRARRGERSTYAPLRSPLSPTADAADVLQGFLALHPFRTVYIADLDAIQRKGSNRAAIEKVRARFPRLELWVDGGFGTRREMDEWRAQELGRPVVGSESLAGETGWRDLPALLEAGLGGDPVLSLDFRGGDFLGPRAVLDHPEWWPRDVIVMSLARVGTRAGPDLGRLHEIVGKAGPRRVFAAAGVRDGRDLTALGEAGAAGALVASALHHGDLGPGELARCAAGRPPYGSTAL